MSNKDSTDEEIIDILLPVEDLRRENADLRADNERLKGVEVYLTEAVDALHSDIEHLKAELGEVTDLYTTYRGLVHDGVQVADVIKSLRGQLAALRISERAWTDQNSELHRQINYIRSLVWDEISDGQIVGNLRRMLDRPKDG